jgi:hypothetical protein
MIDRDVSRCWNRLDPVALTLALCLVGAPLAGAIAKGGEGPAGQEDVAMALESPAFEDGGAIPRRYTCEGEDVAPALRWRDAPSGTQSFALVVDDPDAPDPAAPRMTWVHWVVFDIPESARGLAEGGRDWPPGAREGRNDWKRTGYGGPCPPIGRHRYRLKLYALDTTLALEDPTKAELEAAMAGHVLAEAVLVGTYAKEGAARE